MTGVLPPSPRQFRSIDEWAEHFYEFSLSQQRVTQVNNPLPILIPHRTSGIMERASQSGVLLYCTSCKEAIVSDGTEYLAVTNVPSFSATDIADSSATPNTVNKSAGRVVYDTTNLTLAVANGSTPTDTWSRLTVAATVTPA